MPNARNNQQAAHAPRAGSIELPAYAAHVLDVLEGAGFEAWVVGGFVRDSLLGREVYDVDMACSAPWQETARALKAAGLGVRESGTKHGTVTALVDGQGIEVTQYRTEGAYSDGRHPDSVALAQSIESDLARRDFTVNAIAYHPTRGFCDPFGGIADLQAKLIRAVGNPVDRFHEDSLRILRACRLCSELGFGIEEATLQSMQHGKSFMLNLPAERVTHEFERLLLGEHVHDALMLTVDVLSGVMPELIAMKGFEQHSHYHSYDVLEHTAYVVQRTSPNLLVRWAALFHDIGKPAAFFTRDGVGHFYGHAKLSVVVARGALARLSVSPQMRDDILTLVRIHDDLIGPTPKLVKRALHRLGGNVELFRALCDLKKADALAHAQCCTSRAELADELLQVLEQVLSEQQAFTVGQLAINGSDVMQVCDIPAGPEVGRLLGQALDAVIDGELANERNELCAFVQELANADQIG